MILAYPCVTVPPGLVFTAGLLTLLVTFCMALAALAVPITQAKDNSSILAYVCLIILADFAACMVFGLLSLFGVDFAYTVESI